MEPTMLDISSVCPALTASYSDELTINPSWLDASTNETHFAPLAEETRSHSSASATVESSLTCAIRSVNPDHHQDHATVPPLQANEAQSDGEHSWTEEDDIGSLYFDIEQRLRALLLTDSQAALTTASSAGWSTAWHISCVWVTKASRVMADFDSCESLRRRYRFLFRAQVVCVEHRVIGGRRMRSLSQT